MKILLLTLVSALLLNVSYSQLNYTYYEGTFNKIPNFNSINPSKAGSANNVDIAVRNRDINYSVLWTGNMYITVEGDYTFETNSDDGSLFVLANKSNNQTVTVDNDGLHGTQVRSAKIHLTPGTYPVAIGYIQQGGGQTMEVYYSSNTGIARQRIPDAAFAPSGSTGGSTPTGGSASASGGLTYTYYEGNYSSVPDYRNQNVVKTGTTSNVNLGVRNRDSYYSIVWNGNITIPADGNYTFETKSDDGSKFVLAKSSSQTLVVNNDGLHGDQIVTSSIFLNAGTYPVSIAYFQAAGGQTMEVYWSSNSGISRQLIPDNAFTGGSAAPTTPTTPTAPVAPVAPTEPEPSTPSSPSTPSNESGGLTGSVNYYFSSSAGDDNRSSAQAQNPSTPWRTVAKANSIMNGVPAGGAILFKRGDVFEGGLNVTKGGVIVSSYGTGAKPVITGFATLGGWSQVASGIWEAPCAGQSLVNMVTVNNNLQVMGRWPNITEANKGFLRYEGHAGNSAIFDYNIPYVLDWRGADIVIRKNRWVIDKCLITGYSGNSFSYNSPSPMTPIDGFGYFIQNHPGTLDQFGEWYYNPNSKRLRMFFGNSSPNSFEVKASVVPVLLTVRSISNVVVDNINFNGSNDNAIEVSAGANNADIKNCNVNFAGLNAVMANYVNNFVFEDNTVNNTNNNAMYIAPFVNGSIIRNNVITNTGLYAGMGASNNDALQGIVMQGSNNQILNNTVENTGYNGIKLLGDNIVIKNNYINQFCLTTDDGGGVYASGENTKWGRQIIGNIILNGRGAHEGTDLDQDLAASGVYLDDKTANVDVLNNTIANMTENGIFVHNSHEINVSGNTIYNATRASVVMASDILEPNDPVRNVQFVNNILVAKKPSQLTTWLVTNKNDLWAYGNFDNNAYCRPADDNTTIATLLTDSWTVGNHTLAAWKSLYGKDGYSTKSPVSIPYNANPDDYIKLEFNPGGSPKTVALDGNYVDARYNRYNSTATVPAYSSLILFKITSGTTLMSTPTQATLSADANMEVARTSNEKLSVNVLPNPASERVQIAIKAPAGTKKASLSIFSISGVLVKTIPISLNSQNVGVDISTWKGGTYIINLKFDDQTITKQFIKL
jgi:parallel beta-helix repeat protein